MENFVKDLEENHNKINKIIEKKNQNKMEKEKENIEVNPSKRKDKTFTIFNQVERKTEIKVIQQEDNQNIVSELNFKIILIGNASVGKSSLVGKATKNEYYENYIPTIGFDLSSFYVNYDNTVIKLQIWDTCGQEIYQSLITNFYRNSSLAIMVYSINDRKSFENLDNWLKELKTENNPDVKTILIGNKVDLEKERVVSFNEAEKYAKDYNFDSFFETSAKTGFNAQKVFMNAAVSLYEDYIKYKNVEDDNQNGKSLTGSMFLNKKKIIKQKRKCC